MRLRSIFFLDQHQIKNSDSKSAESKVKVKVKTMKRCQQNILLMEILGLASVRQCLWDSAGSSPPDWSPGCHTAERGTVRGDSRSVPRRGMGGGIALFPVVCYLQGWKVAWTIKLISNISDI